MLWLSQGLVSGDSGDQGGLVKWFFGKFSGCEVAQYSGWGDYTVAGGYVTEASGERVRQVNFASK